MKSGSRKGEPEPDRVMYMIDDKNDGDSSLMRQYIRHPTDIPIEYNIGDLVTDKKEYLNNISKGGISFRSKAYIETGAKIMIRIPFRKPIFKEEGIVVWCYKNNEQYEVGVQFKNAESEYRIRMIEQVCHIEHYKQEVLDKEGRTLSGKEAAAEWIEKYAKDFPHG